VDFPAPLAPTRATTSPSATESETSRTACNRPWRATRLSTWSSSLMFSPFPVRHRRPRRRAGLLLVHRQQ
jgi:hypothetical protein